MTRPSPDLATRRRRLAESLPDTVDGVLVTSLVNVRYLTGFRGSAGAAFVARDGSAALAVDRRYGEQAGLQAPDLPATVTRAYARDLVSASGVKRVGLEAHVLTVEAFRALEQAVPESSLVPLSRPVETLRSVKDAYEIGAIARACRISEQALFELLSRPLLGRTERDIARDLEQRMTDLGAEGPAFPTIVASGPAAAMPHHSPDDRKLAHGDLVVIDFGASVDGYAADTTRTLVVGEASGWQRDLHALVLGAQDAARAALVPGEQHVRASERVAEVFAAAEMTENFLHGLGHSLGLEVHEYPMLSGGEPQQLEPGMVFAVEPGLYLPGRGGVRIEDVVVIGEPPGGGKAGGVAPEGQNVSGVVATGPTPLTTRTRDLLVVP